MAMLRNIDSRFSQAPMELDIQRSRFDRDFDLKTTFNAGDLVPIMIDEILPGDTVELNTNYVCRMSTPIFPVMDNAYLETFFFFVPSRLVWDHWKDFNGENNETYWTQPTEYFVPQIKFPEGDASAPADVETKGFDKGSVADYFGIPTKVLPRNADGTLGISALPFRSYCKVFNDWFRDQNTMQPAYFPTDDADVEGARSKVYNELTGEFEDTDPRLTAYRGGALLKVSKYHDYFTSALPSPQKGPDVSVTMSSNNYIPVFAREEKHSSFDPAGFSSLHFKVDTGYTTGVNHNLTVSPAGYLETSYASTEEAPYGVGVVPDNLWTEVNGSDINLFVNDLRLAFQLQKLYEKDARGGTRYIEILKSHFGVDSPDGRLQRSEYLGGSRQPINVSQVVQTSSTDSTSPQGNTAAFSLTNGSNDTFIKSFTEHGYLIGLACVRTDHTYQQGLDAMWSRQRRFDYYWPVLANIGEQPIFKKEILLTDDADVANEAFGYQEAWASYRYKPSMVTGAFRSNVNGSLDAWHYADYFDPESAPNFVVDETFIQETPVNIDRTLAVQSSLEDQFIANFYFKSRFTRVMPLYSVPGLIDHH